MKITVHGTPAGVTGWDIEVENQDFLNGVSIDTVKLNHETLVKKFSQAVPTAPQVAKVTPDPTVGTDPFPDRYRPVYEAVKALGDKATVGYIDNLLDDMSSSVITRHLRALEAYGHIVRDTVEDVVVYRINGESRGGATAERPEGSGASVRPPRGDPEQEV